MVINYGIICFDGVATVPSGRSTWNSIISNRASTAYHQTIHVQGLVRKDNKPLQEIQHTAWLMFVFLTVASSVSTP